MINRDQVARTVAALSETAAAGDGVALELTSVDDQQGAVEVTLSLEQAECPDCVLPPDRLRDVIGSTLRRDVPELRRLEFTDPQEATQPAWASAPRPDSVTTVLDPIGEVAPIRISGFRVQVPGGAPVLTWPYS